MRRFFVIVLIVALGAPAVIAIPGAVGAEPNWCTGLRKKAQLQRWEFEAFNKHCSAEQAPSARSTEASAKNEVTAAPIIGDATTKPLVDLTSAQGDRNVAASRAISSENVARSAGERLSKCRYKANWLTFVAGLASLARAPKIRDSTQLLSLAAPLPFSVCEQAIDTATTPLIVPASIGLLEGGDAYRLHVLESGYTGAFNVAPTEGGILSVEQALSTDKKTLLRDQFDIKALKFAPSTTVTVQDESGTSKTIRVNITKAPA